MFEIVYLSNKISPMIVFAYLVAPGNMQLTFFVRIISTDIAHA